MNNKLYIIKVGGNIIDDEAKLNPFLSSFAALKGKKILVHGGGKLATQLAHDLSIPQQMVDGRRITDAATLKIVTMVYAGWINKQIVAKLNALGSRSVGICGADGLCILAEKRQHPTIDYGYVGDVKAIDTQLLTTILDRDQQLVVAPITQDAGGQLLNTNADTIAQEIAKAMSVHFETTLIYSFEKKGVMLDINDESSVIHHIDKPMFGELKKNNSIFAGMIPKLENAFAAIDAGVSKVIIGDAMELKEMTEGRSGTAIS